MRSSAFETHTTYDLCNVWCWQTLCLLYHLIRCTDGCSVSETDESAMGKCTVPAVAAEVLDNFNFHESTSRFMQLDVQGARFLSLFHFGHATWEPATLECALQDSTGELSVQMDVRQTSAIVQACCDIISCINEMCMVCEPSSAGPWGMVERAGMKGFKSLQLLTGVLSGTYGLCITVAACPCNVHGISQLHTPQLVTYCSFER